MIEGEGLVIGKDSYLYEMMYIESGILDNDFVGQKNDRRQSLPNKIVADKIGTRKQGIVTCLLLQ